MRLRRRQCRQNRTDFGVRSLGDVQKCAFACFVRITGETPLCFPSQHATEIENANGDSDLVVV